MKIMKFGGTSIRDAEAITNVTEIIINHRKDQPVVVLSAMAGVTDLLEDALQAAVTQDTQNLEKIILKIEHIHIEAIRTLFENKQIFENLQHKIHAQLSKLKTLLSATQTIKVESEDLVHAILSTGELLSSMIIFNLFHSRELQVGFFDVRKIMITRKEHGEVQPDYARIKDHTEKYLRPLLKKHEIIVTQGFIAESLEGAPSTLGRNGSDHSASLIGAALNASEIQIWTDVDGILTADPSIISDARLLNSMTFDEACELAYFGARVLHPASIQPALEQGIPVRVLNSHFPQQAGTIILKQKLAEDKSKFKSIVYKEGITLLTVESSHLLLSPRIMGEFFQHLSEHGKRVYLVSKSATKLTLTIESRKDLHHLLQKIDHIGDVHIEANKSIVSIVGEGIRENPEVIWQIIRMLTAEGIRLELISQVASQISFMFIIDETNIDKTVKLLHKNFISNE